MFNHITSFVSVDPYCNVRMDIEKDQYRHQTVKILQLQSSLNIWGLASNGLLTEQDTLFMAFSDLGPLCNYEYEQILCYKMVGKETGARSPLCVRLKSICLLFLKFKIFIQRIKGMFIYKLL
jgi:hypothetical protein